MANKRIDYTPHGMLEVDNKELLHSNKL